MPQLIGAAIGAVASRLVQRVVVGTIGRILAGVAAAVVGGLVTRALTPRPRPSAAISAQGGRSANIRQPISPWQVVYGEARVGGTITYAHSDRLTLHMVLTLTGHECAALHDVWFGDRMLVMTPAGAVESAPFAGRAHITRSLGSEIGQPFPEIIGPWLDDWRQTGRGKVHVRLTASAEAYPNGVPAIAVLVHGRRVFDPRNGITRWSNNAALCAADYLTNAVFGVGATEVDTARLIAAANLCDERVRIAQVSTAVTGVTFSTLRLAAGQRVPAVREGVRLVGALPAPLLEGVTYHVMRGSAGGIQLAASAEDALAGVAISITGTSAFSLLSWDEPRYTANGSFTTDSAPREVLGLLLAAMAGKAVHVGGRWSIYAGGFEVPTLSLDENDLVGSVQVQSMMSRRESCTAVKGVFTDPQTWQPTSFPALRPPSLDPVVWRDMDLAAFVARSSQAQRLAKIELLSSREALSVEVECSVRAWLAHAGSTIMLSFARYGWSGKVFEVTESRFVLGAQGELLVRLGLRETAAAIYDWATAEDALLDIAPNTQLPHPGDVGPPGVPLVREELYETREGRGVAAKALVSWAASSYLYGASYELQHHVGGPWISHPLTRSTSAEILDLAPGVYVWRVRTQAVNGAASPWSQQVTASILGLSAPPSVPVIRSIQAMGGLAVLTMATHPDMDVRRGGRFIVRHSAAMVGATWPESLSIGDADGVSGDQTVIILPLKAGSYLVRAQDSTGHQSAGEAIVTTKQASVLAYSTISTVIENPSFSGVHDGTVSADGVLRLQPPALAGVYQFASGMDFGAVSRRRLTGELQAIVVDVLHTLDTRAANMDTWPSFDGATGTGAPVDAFIEARQTDDNPIGSPVWSAWQRLDAAEFVCRAVQFRAHLRSTDPGFNIHVSGLRVIAEGV